MDRAYWGGRARYFVGWVYGTEFCSIGGTCAEVACGAQGAAGSACAASL